MHSIADFYSHSNYIDLYQQYVTANPGTSTSIYDIPTLSEAMQNPELMDFIESKGGLKTGTFSMFNPKSSKEGSHNKMNLDTKDPIKSPKGAEKYNNRGATKHDAARAVAEKDLKQMAGEVVL